MRTAAIVTALVALSALNARSQTKFEAASIRVTPPDSREPLDIRFEPGGRLTVTNETLDVLVRYAYGVKRWQILGAPDWLSTDRFDISAKAQGDPGHDEMLKMFQALLEERFKLKLHRETKEGSVYLLTVVKNGPKLQQAKELKEGERAGVFTLRTGSPQQPAISYIRRGRRATMAMLASALEDQAQRPVLDRTGLTGDFDFDVQFAADDSHLDEFPTLFTALHDQLGLKLESAKGPIETLVMEHIERVPIAN